MKHLPKLRSLSAKQTENSQDHNQGDFQISRRRVVQWSVPVLTMVSLPAHAQCSEGLDENAMPVVTASVKCTLNTATNTFIGQSIIEITSDGGPISINAISVDGIGPNDSVTVPDTPVIIDSSTSIQILWDGESTDGITCLPLNNFTINLQYGCTNVAEEPFSVQIIDLLL